MAPPVPDMLSPDWTNMLPPFVAEEESPAIN